jgi:hypothetical protein
MVTGSFTWYSGVSALDASSCSRGQRVFLDQNSPAVDAVQRDSTEPTRTVGLNLTLFSGSQALYELEGIGGADPLDVRFHRELIDASELPRIGPGFTHVSVSDVTSWPQRT